MSENTYKKCGARMAKSKTIRDGRYVWRYLKCPACNTTLRCKFLPEQVVETVEVQVCTKSVLSLPQNGPISTATPTPAIEQ